ncbi:hypothetical protein [Shinella sp.]|uniref:hypothetical protein n=1 Tax=Shinella sp. TaxID=1870904 RepID=UPI003F72D3E9
MVTDLGIELGVALDILHRKKSAAHATENRSKLRLHILTISAFLLGGIIGVKLYQAIAGYLLIIAAVLLWHCPQRSSPRAWRSEGNRNAPSSSASQQGT